MGMFDFLKKDRREVDKILDLRQLEHLLDYDEAAYEERKKEDEEEKVQLKRQYGERWQEVYDKRHSRVITKEEHDRQARIRFNQEIYDGRYVLDCMSPGYFRIFQAVRESRMKEVYGENYERLYSHKRGDPEAVELLLQDAVKTGRWNELPECLQEECKNRMFRRVKR